MYDDEIAGQRSGRKNTIGPTVAIRRSNNIISVLSFSTAENPADYWICVVSFVNRRFSHYRLHATYILCKILTIWIKKSLLDKYRVYGSFVHVTDILGEYVRCAFVYRHLTLHNRFPVEQDVSMAKIKLLVYIAVLLFNSAFGDDDTAVSDTVS